MGFEFWGPRLPERRRKTSQGSPSKEAPKIDFSSNPVARHSQDAPAPEDVTDPLTSKVLGIWEEQRRRDLESKVDTDIWSRIKKKIEGND